jgi:hypothetical protein
VADYLDCCRRLYQFLEDMESQTRFLPKQLMHRRGQYPSADIGISVDQGQLETINLYIPPNISEGVGAICDSLELDRIIGFCDC